MLMRTRPFAKLPLSLLAWVLLLATDAGAEATSLLTGKTPAQVTAAASTEAKAELNSAAVAAQRLALRKEIAEVRAELEKLPEGKMDDAALWLTQVTAILERIDSVYLEQENTLQHAADLAKETAEVERLATSLGSPETTFKPPFNLKLLETLYGERDYLERAEDILKADIATVSRELGDARDELEEKNRARRSAREAVTGAANLIEAQGRLRVAELETRLVEETVKLRAKALAVLKTQQALLAPKRAVLGPRLDWLRKNLVIAAEEVAAEKQKADKRASELDEAIQAARQESDEASRRVLAVERRGAAASQAAELDSRRADRQTANYTLATLTAQRERLGEFHAVLTLRQKIFGGGVPSGELREWAGENDVALDRLNKERARRSADLSKSRREMELGQTRLLEARSNNGERVEAWMNDRLARLQGWIALNERDLADIAALIAARTRLKEELSDRVTLFSVRDTTTAGRENLIAAWNYEVFSVKDQPVRVKTILGVILLVWLGHWLARRTSALIGSAVFHRLGMNPGRRAAWQTLSFYALFLIVLLVAFNLFHLSLTQFSVMSGALAVGIGFGSQNLISNFISGIILLVERPINQGDVIEIDGKQVTVERLGPRSTIVRSVDNTHIIVPNSRLLEQSVINWTLSDDVIRKQIRVGVAYDSSTRRVAELLSQVLAGVEHVCKEPVPVVKFADFGDNSLIFDLYFWVALCDQHGVEDEIRHRIAEVFTQEKIIMAFPQRDVHLETTKPLRIEVVNAGHAMEVASPAPASTATPMPASAPEPIEPPRSPSIG